ncbi:hypothetical protein V7S43_015420 [Phytophthora oleae]|uniref:Secreted protein n=1 Tax=Phytophthora oleae TaxID=2107226 RepID=A0ABD3EYV6_9STRA
MALPLDSILALAVFLAQTVELAVFLGSTFVFTTCGVPTLPRGKLPRHLGCTSFRNFSPLILSMVLAHAVQLSIPLYRRLARACCRELAVPTRCYTTEEGGNACVSRPH